MPGCPGLLLAVAVAMFSSFSSLRHAETVSVLSNHISKTGKKCFVMMVTANVKA